MAEMTSPHFLPQTLGMDDLIKDWSGVEIVPNELLLFELFDVYRRHFGDDAKYATFEEFISFGDMLLADFSEIDLYCVDAQRLFSNLHDIKAIGEWDIEVGHLTPFQEKYLHFYQSLYHLYTGLRDNLLSQHRAYAGMAYRLVAENVEEVVPGGDAFAFA